MLMSYRWIIYTYIYTYYILSFFSRLSLCIVLWLVLLLLLLRREKETRESLYFLSFIFYFFHYYFYDDDLLYYIVLVRIYVLVLVLQSIYTHINVDRRVSVFSLICATTMLLQLLQHRFRYTEIIVSIIYVEIDV